MTLYIVKMKIVNNSDIQQIILENKIHTDNGPQPERGSPKNQKSRDGGPVKAFVFDHFSD